MATATSWLHIASWSFQLDDKGQIIMKHLPPQLHKERVHAVMPWALLIGVALTHQVRLGDHVNAFSTKLKKIIKTAVRFNVIFLPRSLSQLEMAMTTKIKHLLK